MTTLRIDITSDFICPWCHIGEERLFAAARRVDGLTLDVHWRPFELNPTMPAEGMDRRTYRSRKFGSWERSQVLDAEVTAVGRAHGLPFDFSRITRTPNTRLAHRLAWFAEEHGKQEVVVPAIFRAYFEHGRDIGRLDELVRLAAQAGLAADEVCAVLAGPRGIDEVVRMEQSALEAGIRAVPHVELGGHSFDGALGEDDLEELLRSALDAIGAKEGAKS